MDLVLLLEDDASLREALHADIRRCSSAHVWEATSLRQAIRLLDSTSPTLVVAELALSDGTGLDLLPELAARRLKVPVIFISEDLGRAPPELPEGSNIEVIHKPLDRDAFTRLVVARLERHRSLPPPASVFTVADYLQLASMTRRSVRLTVSSNDGSSGQIVIQDGEPSWAGDARGPGLEAFRRLALLPRAEIRCEPCAQSPELPNLSGSLEQLLLDAARTADEEQSPAAEASPPPAREPQRESPRSSDQPVDSEPVTDGGRPGAVAPRTPAPGASSAAVAPGSPAGPLLRSLDARRPPPPMPPPIPQRPPARKGASAGISNAANPMVAQADGPRREKEIMVKQTDPSRAQGQLSKLVDQNSTIRAAAHAEQDGSVIDFHGEMDAESDCAVVAFAARHVDDIAEELGIGRPASWCVSAGASSWYVVQDQQGFVLAVGEPTKNPMAVLGKVASGGGK